MDNLDQQKILKKGAEASLYLANWQGRKAVFKARLPKEYRVPELDEEIRNYRSMHEAQLLNEAKKARVPTPMVYRVDIEGATIVMELIEGEQLKKILGKAPKKKRKELCLRIGEAIGRLHKHGIIHGDLTTSNMVLSESDRIFFIDFGLGEKTQELEAKGVDLHLMKRALQSTHFQIALECFKSIIEGYQVVLGEEETKKVLEKIGEIEKRGRYIAERKAD